MDVWAAPAGLEPKRSDGPRLREDLVRALAVVVGCVLLGAPAGLLWSRLAPHLHFSVTDRGLDAGDLTGDKLLSTKAFIGADGTYLLVMVAFGIACGLIAWLAARRSGPWTVAGLAVGGALAALVAARVGLMPGTDHALEALKQGTQVRGEVSLYLGTLHGKVAHLRSPWAAVGWPVGALVAFLVCMARRPEDVD